MTDPAPEPRPDLEKATGMRGIKTQGKTLYWNGHKVDVSETWERRMDEEIHLCRYLKEIHGIDTR